jgi:sugar lactone lactonase YvrE
VAATAIESTVAVRLLACSLGLLLAACGGSSGGSSGGNGGQAGGGSGGAAGMGTGGAPMFPTVATYKNVPLPSTPNGLAVDASGNVWVACAGEDNNGNIVNAVVKVTPQGTVTAQYPLDQFAQPNALAIDAGGNIWVAGTTTPLPSRYNGTPYCCAGDPHESVTQLSPSGAVLQNVLLLSNNSTPSGNLGSSVLVAIDAQGNVWVTDQAISQGGSNANSLFEVSPAGAVVQTIALHNDLPSGLALDAAGNAWLSAGTKVLKVLGGAVVATTDLMGSLNNLAVDLSGNVWVAGGNNAIATAVGSTGTVVKTSPVPGGASGGFPWGLAIDHAAHVWITNTDLDGPVAEIDAAGKLVGNYSDASFTGALTGIAIDGSGNVWVGNYSGKSLVKIVGAAQGPQSFPFSGPLYPL